MKAWVKRRWLMALRSGEFEQGSGNLAVDDGEVTRYCCLGVLCEISPIPVERQPESPVLRWDGNSLILPSSVAQWAGCSNDPVVQWGDRKETLSGLNDDYKMSLTRIAQAIEEDVPAEVEHHTSPLPCGRCGQVGQCRTASGAPCGRHAATITNDRVWSVAHTALDLGNIDEAVAHLVTLDKVASAVSP